MERRPPDAPPQPTADPQGSGPLSSKPVSVGPRIGPPGSGLLEIGSLFAGRYRIQRFLGAGGMGEVYQALDSLLGRRVAIKIPGARALGDPSYHRRFMREAQAAARLSHANICIVYDTGIAETTPYIAMAYVEGRPLSALVADGARLEPEVAVRLVRVLATALQVAHDAGVLHLDLKPANVMLAPDGKPVIMDFGLARLTDPDATSLTLDATLMGTPAYMAPEQIEGARESYGPPTDVYGLGAIFYELLTGHPPFRGTLLAVLDQTRRALPEPPSRLAPGIGPGLDAVCLVALAKKTSERYASMNELLAALETGLEAPTEPFRPPVPEAEVRAPDRERLVQSTAERRAWDVLFYAKRLLQTNERDGDAYNALAHVTADPRDLVYFDPVRRQSVLNAFTRSMDVRTMVDFVRESELIERDAGDVICRYNEPSHTMFLILRGEVGVYLPGGERTESDHRREPDFRFGPGQIVGELAFALKRRRTATVCALSRSSLLAFSYTRLRELSERGLLGPMLSHSVDAYLKTRVLKFVFDSARYLAQRTPSITAVEPWQLVSDHTEIVPVDNQRAPLLTPETCPQLAERRGLVLLAGGSVRAEHIEDKVLGEAELPILFARFDDRYAYGHERYRLDVPVTLVHLHQAAFLELGRLHGGTLHEVADRVRRASAAQFHYDVFLSAAHHDAAIASRWKDHLEAAGLRVFVDGQRAPSRAAAVIRAALLDSLLLVPLCTPNTSTRRVRDNRIWRVIAFRSAAFEENANILPVTLGGAGTDRLVRDHAPLEAAGREDEAIREVVEAALKLRRGELPVPSSSSPPPAEL